MHVLDANRPLFPPEDSNALQGVIAHFGTRPLPPVTVVTSGQPIAVPDEVVEAVVQVVTAMADGLAVVVLPLHRTLTTQRAANLLGLRRRDVIDLLDAGEIPHHQDGRHRRVELADLLAYATKRSEEQYAAINEMVEIGYESNQHILCSAPDVA